MSIVKQNHQIDINGDKVLVNDSDQINDTISGKFSNRFSYLSLEVHSIICLCFVISCRTKKPQINHILLEN